VFDFWFDGELVELVVMQQLETPLQKVLSCRPTKLLRWSTARLTLSSAVVMVIRRRN
tara:strand:+ start:336 stop:506 length:171 start_codon:yes stop_codon:yes gene_type:complete